MINMTWCNDSSNDVIVEKISCSSSPSRSNNTNNGAGGGVAQEPDKTNSSTRNCPSCGHHIVVEQQGRRINELPGLPAGVRFDPTDQEILLHLEGKVKPESRHRLHPLIDEFIPTLEGENGICYTHPEKLPGVNKDGQVRHFFHRPSKAYTTGTRKRRKVHTDEDGSETRWHKTGKTRPIVGGGKVKGYKKILVLYTNYGKQKKPEKTSWVMHQYHLGLDEEEKEGELVVSKVFYQTQPRQCSGAAGSAPIISLKLKPSAHHHTKPPNDVVQYPSSSIISFDQRTTSTGGRASPSTAIFPFCCP